MPLPPELLGELQRMPRQLEHALSLIPTDRMDWKPESWGGCRSENFSVVEQMCHLRDLWREAYHARIRRMLDEVEPCLEASDGYKMPRERRYETTELTAALTEFRRARSATLKQLRSLRDGQLARTGEFAEYGRLSLRALVHYLRSRDQQHLAGIQWLAGNIVSPQ